MMKRARIVISILYAIMLILLLVKIYLTAQFSELDESYATLIYKRDAQKHANMVLRAQILQYKAFSTLDQEARKQGFIDTIHFYP